MIQFETQLKKLKHMVLKQVIIHAKEKRLTLEDIENIPYEIITGDKASYRCCVYKERAIVAERLKLATCNMPNGDGEESLVNIKDDGQVIYVIEAACDRCPINRFTVTEACRGCLAHKCMEVCPVNAITQVGGRAYINQELCKECGMCKKVCPYNAISEVMRPCKRVCPTGALEVNEEDRQAQINNDQCINCGMCMSACPFGAISDKSYVVSVTRALQNGKKLYAIVAPAIVGQFGPKVSPVQIKNAFLKLGFTNMLEAACGADAVTVSESKEFAEKIKGGQKYMVNSCCAGLVDYIEKKFPGEATKISSTVSPMIATARLIKKNDPEAVTIFVGPCTAKKAEIKRDYLKGDVDYVLTFEEIFAFFDAFEIDPETLENGNEEEASLYGRNFAKAGGLTEAIENYAKTSNLDVSFVPISVSGPDEIKKALTMAKVNRLSGNFLEGMMCEGGCIGGPATVLPQFKVRPALLKFSSSSCIKAVIDNKILEEFKEINLHRH